MTHGRIVRILDTQWRFTRKEVRDPWYKAYDDSTWRVVQVPHDWSVDEAFDEAYSSGTGYAAGGLGWYRKRFIIEEALKGKRVYVTFDGIYKDSQVWCNGHNLGKRPYGYSSFTYDLTPFIVFTETDDNLASSNIICVRVDRQELADSRWYTGAGIYRQVRLTMTDQIRIDEYSPFILSPQVSPREARTLIRAAIHNHTGKTASVEIRTSILESGERLVSQDMHTLLAGPGNTDIPERQLTLPSPRLWSPESPELYTVTQEIFHEGILADEVRVPFGFRSFSFDPHQGFFLNGKNLKLKGVCLHHDAGCLGTAVPEGVWEHRLRLLKDMGCNAIRTSHNPPDPSFLDLCDRLGFLVMDEAFDEWEGVKHKWSRGHNVYPPEHHGYGDDFPVWHRADLSSMVLRDRNHPSIILWSIGNEIDYPNDPYCHPLFSTMEGNNDAHKPAEEQRYDPDKPNAARLADLACELFALVKSLDPTRPVTAALAFPELSNLTGYAEALDVVGYNYKEALYTQDHRSYPNRSLYGSENSPGLPQWQAVLDKPYIAGQFIWTGIDYLGEAALWPIRAAPSGFLDLAGFPKPSYYLRRSLWSEEPTLYLTAKQVGPFDRKGEHRWLGDAPHWNFLPNDRVELLCYTNLEPVELFLNGRSLGKKRLRDATDGYLSWETDYEAGCVEGIATDPTGREYRCIIETSGDPCSLEILTENQGPNEDDRKLIQLVIQLKDGADRPVRHTDAWVQLTALGPGILSGLENGDVADSEPYKSGRRKTKGGRLRGYVRLGKTGEPQGENNSGPLIIRASGADLGTTELKIEIKNGKNIP